MYYVVCVRAQVEKKRGMSRQSRRLVKVYFLCDSVYTIANYKYSDFSRPMATQTPSDGLMGLNGCDGLPNLRLSQHLSCCPGSPLYEQRIVTSLPSSDEAPWHL
jgi:hypothetical protein